jgi:glycosyltransferase involved in cell wall biosynthesis
MRIGFSCLWDSPPGSTWSGTPWHLYQALGRRVSLTDVGVHQHTAERLLWKLAYLRLRPGRRVESAWPWSRAWERMATSRLGCAVVRAQCDAVVQVQDFARPRVPFFVYQDLSFDLLNRQIEESGAIPPGFSGLTEQVLRRLLSRQRKFYAEASGVLTMSRWLAHSLVEDSGVPAERVHVVHAGANVPIPAHPTQHYSEKRRVGPPRVLFVGRDFWRKGGDVVVQAVELLRRKQLPDLQLTVAGPPHWPMAQPVPDGVTFVGAVAPDRTAALYAEHDLFAMPSRFEAFGIVFIEALAHGLPCIGRNAFAIPEIVTPEFGKLVDKVDIDEVAAAIIALLDDPSLARRCRSWSQTQGAYWTWDRVASDALRAIEATSLKKPCWDCL